MLFTPCACAWKVVVEKIAPANIVTNTRIAMVVSWALSFRIEYSPQHCLPMKEWACHAKFNNPLRPLAPGVCPARVGISRARQRTAAAQIHQRGTPVAGPAGSGARRRPEAEAAAHQHSASARPQRLSLHPARAR